MFCRAQLGELHERRDDLAARGAEVVPVAMATPERTVRFYEAQGLAFRAACSPDGAAHAAYGLTRLRWSDLLAPRVLVRGIGAFLRGSRPGRMDGDVLLRPGTFVVDAAGLVIFARRGRDPADRPSLSELLSALDA